MEERIHYTDGGELLTEYAPGKRFYYLHKGEWEPVEVESIWVDVQEAGYQIHANLILHTFIQIHHVISKEQYEEWQSAKSDKRRFDILLAAFRSVLKIRKIPATQHIDIRVTPELYKQLKGYADTCKMSLSDYCREILKGCSAPKAALSEDERRTLMNVEETRHNLVQFRDASLGFLKGKSKEERLNMLIQGTPYSWWRVELQKCLIYLDQLIDRAKR